MTDELIEGLKAIGGQNPKTEYRTSYSLIGYTGPGKLEATTEVSRCSNHRYSRSKLLTHSIITTA